MYMTTILPEVANNSTSNVSFGDEHERLLLNRIVIFWNVTTSAVTMTSDLTSTFQNTSTDNGEVIKSWIGTLAALHLLVICVGANVILIVSVKRRWSSSPATTTTNTVDYSSGKSSNVCRLTSPAYGGGINNNNINGNSVRNVEMLISLIAGVGLINGSGICIAQITSHFSGNWIFSDTSCKLQGMASNLMTFAVIWYEALFGFERYLKFTKPQDYQVTFSKINLQIIALGIFLVLLSAVCGPLYGWGTYTYSRDVHMCQLDLMAPNAVSYFALSTASYIITPYAIMAYSCSALLFNIHFPDREWTSNYSKSDHVNTNYHFGTISNHCNSMERRRIVLPLAVSVAVSFLLQLPKYISETTTVLALLSISIDGSTKDIAVDDLLIKYISCWLHTFGVNGCFACVLLLFHVCNGCCNRRCRNIKSTSTMTGRRISESLSRRTGRCDVEIALSNNQQNRRSVRFDKLCLACWPLMSSGRHRSSRDVRSKTQRGPIVLVNRMSVDIVRLN